MYSQIVNNECLNVNVSERAYFRIVIPLAIWREYSYRLFCYCIRESFYRIILIVILLE